MAFDKNSLPDIMEREKAFELRRTYEAANDALYETEHDGEEAFNLAKAREYEAEEAYDACGISLLLDPQGNAVRCAVSGTPVLESDEAVIDQVTDEVFLRVAIGLPPRPSEPEEQVLPDMEDVA